MKPLLQRLPTLFFFPIFFLSAQQKRGSAQCENCAPWEVNTWPLGRRKLCFRQRELQKWHQIRTMKEGKPWTERCTKANWCWRFLTLNIIPSNVNVSNWINCFVLFFCDGSNLTSQHSCRCFVQGCTRCKRVVLPVPLFWSPWAEHVRFSHTDGQFHTKRSSGSNSLRAS